MARRKVGTLTWSADGSRVKIQVMRGYRSDGSLSETSGIKTGRAVEYRVVSTGRSSGMERHDPGCRRF